MSILYTRGTLLLLLLLFRPSARNKLHRTLSILWWHHSSLSHQHPYGARESVRYGEKKDPYTHASQEGGILHAKTIGTKYFSILRRIV